MKNVWIIAQADEGGSSVITGESIDGSDAEPITQAPGTPVDPNAPQGGIPSLLGNKTMLIFWGLMIVMMYFMMVRGPKKKQKQHTDMVKGLSKNDRIRTVGGIIGTVIEVKGEEVVLKIDESNNTKIRIAASAIGKNLSKDSQ
ncbi:MAG: preprotein translocase subunit YajC [Phycisphaeraceae bacterium]|nr:preprotein translocase subunit YajC [Phycisphaeraceae bacterium]